MLGFILVVVNGIAAYRLRGTGLFVPAIISTAVCFWSVGIMHNYKHDSHTPRFPATLGIVASIAGIVLLIVSLL